MNRLRTILLTILLAVAYGAAGQGYVIDSVCRGAERHYRIDGETGSTYMWTLTDELGNVVTLPETADTVTIVWNMNAGEYILSTLQTGIHGCDSLELGTIRVFETPQAYAGSSISICAINQYSLTDATASGYRSLLWISSGDGTFDDSTAIKPVYTFGPNDISVGSVTLSLTATGFGREGSCDPAVSSVTITLNNKVIPVFTAIGPLCQNSAAPVLPVTSTNGISGTWSPSTVNTSQAGTYTYIYTPDANQCASVLNMEITINAKVPPVFAPIGALCLNATAPALPTTSIDGITGTWNPATINTSVDTTINYTFTPDAGQCALPFVLTVEVGSPEITGIQAYTSTNGLANGYAIINATGTGMPFTYSLNGTDWQANNVFRKLLAGTYTAWVMNANGCITTQQFVIVNTVTGVVQVHASDVESCISIPFTIPVMAYDFTNISSFTIRMSFDSSIISFNGLSQVNALLNNGDLSATLLSPGLLEIVFNAADSITLLSEDLLFTLNLYGLIPGVTELKWDWLKCVIYSSAGYEIPAIYTEGLVEIRPAPQIYTAGNGGYCELTPLKLSAGSLTGQNLTYNWTSPNGTTHLGPDLDLGALSLNESGKYEVMATDSSTCTKTETVEVQVFPNPRIQLSDHDTLCSDQEVILNPGAGFASYTWQDGSNEPQMVVTAEGIYWVVVTDYNGCQDTDTVLLRPCELLIWVPNVFSPNGDGLNDEFMAKSNLDVDIDFQMLVFNKWGEQVFMSNDISKGWDGTYEGEICPVDMYTWVITFTAPPTYNFLQKSPQRGNVMLLK
jgi:gliding motility-associated-like protein